MSMSVTVATWREEENEDGTWSEVEYACQALLHRVCPATYWEPAEGGPELDGPLTRDGEEIDDVDEEIRDYLMDEAWDAYYSNYPRDPSF